VGSKQVLKGARTIDNAFSGLIKEGLQRVFLSALNKTEDKLPRWIMFTDPPGDLCEKACCTFTGVDMRAPELFAEAVYVDKEKPELGASYEPLQGDDLNKAAWKVHRKTLKNCVKMLTNV
jgi:hypothetical protein